MGIVISILTIIGGIMFIAESGIETTKGKVGAAIIEMILGLCCILSGLGGLK